MKQEIGADFADTASSQFYPNKSLAARKSKTPADSCTLEGLEEQIAKIKETILSEQQLIQRLEANEQLRNYVQETKQELKVVRARNMNELANVKASFQQNLGSLQRELASVKSNWSSYKQRAEGELQEQIQTFKDTIKQDEAQLSKSLATAGASLRNKANLVLQEMRETKRHRTESTCFLMQQIEDARARLDASAESERKKRNQYEEIVLGLLDRTIEQGERLLRRIC